MGWDPPLSIAAKGVFFWEVHGIPIRISRMLKIGAFQSTKTDQQQIKNELYLTLVDLHRPLQG